MADTAKQIYELAFHISSNLEDADVQKTRQEIEKYVTSNGGTVLFSKDLEKMRLAYQIQHQTTSYFGYFHFNLESAEALTKIRDEILLNKDILRFLIMKQEPEQKLDKEDVVRKLAQAEKRRMKAVKQAEKPVQKTEESMVSEKELEEKLEEIIDKL